MPIAIVIIFLLGLWAFIIWDRGQTIAPLSREALKHGWVAKPIPTWPIFTGFATVSASLGVQAYLTPSQPPFTGRFSIVFSTIHSNFGSNGIVYFWVLTTIVLAVFALFTWRGSVVSTSKNI